MYGVEQVRSLLADVQALARGCRTASSTDPAARRPLAALVRRSLTVLDSGRDLLDTLLLAQDRHEAKGGAGAAPVPRAAVKWLGRLQASAAELATGAAGLSVCSVRSNGDSWLVVEKCSLLSLLHAAGVVHCGVVPSGHTAGSWQVDMGPRTRLLALVSITNHLRRLERDMDFQKALVADTVRLLGDGGAEYSRENYSYGSTPFHTWHAVFRLPAVASALDRCLHRENSAAPVQSQSHVAVFGASHGMLAFNAALTFGVRTAGYELLPYLHGVATGLAADHKLPDSLLSFTRGDMLDASVGRAAVVLLTSQCWDTDLRAAVYRKLREEAPCGCVVVDYVSELDTVPGFQACGSFVGQVSWDPDLKFHLYKRVEVE